ncbi:MAG: NAD-dependent epimerase/dehydratase family protein [Verrucomicrobiae bacterium]|nr:NAD-dependent epimerase/dehydratase family protein [Verrucomicrobiae bacterium]
MNQPILIAGLGYLGSALADALSKEGRAVAGLTKSEPDPTRSGRRSYPVWSCDLSDREAVLALADHLRSTGQSPSHLIHCASSGRGGPEAYRAVFVDGSRHLIDAFPGVPLFFTSSTSVYPQTDGSTVTETSPTEPDRETGRQLLEAERQVLAAGGTVLRLAGLYGPSRSVHLQKFLSGTATIESGPVSRWLNQLHRDDAVGAIVHLLTLPPEETRGQIFNVADDTPITQRTCYEQLATHFSRPLPPEAPPDPDPNRGWTHKVVSNAKLRDTGWEPKYPSFHSAVSNDPTLVPSIRERLEDAD